MGGGDLFGLVVPVLLNFFLLAGQFLGLGGDLSCDRAQLAFLFLAHGQIVDDALLVGLSLLHEAHDLFLPAVVRLLGLLDFPEQALILPVGLNIHQLDLAFLQASGLVLGLGLQFAAAALALGNSCLQGFDASLARVNAAALLFQIGQALGYCLVQQLKFAVNGL